MGKLRSKIAAGAAIGGAAVGGAAIANAATSSSTSSTSTATSAATAGGTQTRPPFPAPGTAAHEDAEKPVTGSAAAKARVAAVKATGGGTAGAVTTDFSGLGYEVMVTKPSGSKIEIHLDSSFRVMRGPAGPSRGAPGGHAPGAPGGHAPGAPGGQTPGAPGAQAGAGGYGAPPGAGVPGEYAG